MEVINLKENQKFLKQYVSLRNKYSDLLLTRKVTIEETEEWLKKASVEIRCLIEKNELLGVVILYQDKNNEVTIFVKDLGKRLGGKLLSIMDEVAQAKEIVRLWAWVLASNTPAQRLFKECGYQKKSTAFRNFNKAKLKGYIYIKILKVKISENMEKHINHLPKEFAIKPGAEKFPLMVVVSITYVCNARCPHCPYTNSNIRETYRDALFIKPEIFKKIADECGKYHAYIRLTGGGEPLLHPQMIELIEYAKKKNARIGLITNGSVLTSDKADRLLAANTDVIEFSVDAADKETHSKIRVGLDFNEVKRNIFYLVKKRNKLKSDTEIVASIVEQKANVEQLDKIIKYWGKIVDNVQIRKYLTWNILNEDDAGDPTPYYKKRPPCPHPFERLNIDTRGKILFCGFDIRGETDFGNVTETSIRDIWKGKKFNEWRKLILKGEYGKIGICKRCQDWRYKSWTYNYWKVLRDAKKKRKVII